MTLDLFSDSLPPDLLTSTTVSSAVIAGCRRKLLTERLNELQALRNGFTFGGRLDLTRQLAPIPTAQLLVLIQGKVILSADDIASCFDWDSPKGFPPASGAVQFLHEIVISLSEARQRLLLQWCTSLSAQPIGGLKSKVSLVLRSSYYGSAVDATFPDPHTCSHELELPDYSSKAVCLSQLLRALDDFAEDPRFHQE